LIIELSKRIEGLNKKIEELKLKLSRYPYDLSEGEELISVIIMSIDQKIHQSFICKNTEKFSRLEEIIYKEAPDYMESDIYFCINGNVVKRYKTLKENNIHNGDIIMLNKRVF
jgi:glutamate synthase domain-containing protein 1